MAARMIPPVEVALHRLIDRTEISETVTRYFNALDHRDWEGLGRTLADSIRLDFEQLFGDPPADVPRDAFVAFCDNALSGFSATQHMSPNHVIEIEGDRATCHAYMYAWHTVPMPSHLHDTFVLRGFYIAGLARDGDRWRIASLEMTVWDEAGNKGVYEAAAERRTSEAG